MANKTNERASLKTLPNFKNIIRNIARFGKRAHVSHEDWVMADVLDSYLGDEITLHTARKTLWDRLYAKPVAKLDRKIAKLREIEYKHQEIWTEYDQVCKQMYKVKHGFATN